MVWVRGVGRGGKTLFGAEPRGERFKENLLILFDRQQVLAALFVENLLYRLHLGVGRIGQHEFTDHVQLGQQLARGRDFIAAFLDHRRAQPAPQAYRQKLSGGLPQFQSYFGGGPDHSFLAFYLSNLGPVFYNFLLDHV